MGIEILLRALLKAMGYEKEQWDAFVEWGKTQRSIYEAKFTEFENRTIAIERAQKQILENQVALANHLMNQPGQQTPDSEKGN